ncbi:hypothetical protein CkaCkLH20_04049 [Colletotrichum karsti]|uniref:Uncharacterized protein n=1 Tax=Colletotrichum karsti TaxID=1095194 RepID=A0A9P6IA38_9PEZI|nr:uncharacterized protein CkaCkLH20_04049 [Colletotrichum karsti]KAF9878557.1 hypothetical protein CkaCkLH20_04049 [Colletotrichum karsti]
MLVGAQLRGKMFIMAPEVTGARMTAPNLLDKPETEPDSEEADTASSSDRCRAPPTAKNRAAHGPQGERYLRGGRLPALAARGVENKSENYRLTFMQQADAEPLLDARLTDRTFTFTHHDRGVNMRSEPDMTAYSSPTRPGLSNLSVTDAA